MLQCHLVHSDIFFVANDYSRYVFSKLRLRVHFHAETTNQSRKILSAIPNENKRMESFQVYVIDQNAFKYRVTNYQVFPEQQINQICCSEKYPLYVVLARFRALRRPLSINRYFNRDRWKFHEITASALINGEPRRVDERNLQLVYNYVSRVKVRRFKTEEIWLSFFEWKLIFTIDHYPRKKNQWRKAMELLFEKTKKLCTLLYPQ